MRLQFPTRCLLVASALTCFATSAQSQVLSEWLNPVDGNWDNPANWTTPATPNNGGGTTYDALIAAGGLSHYTIEMDNISIALDSLILNDANATLSLIRSDLTMGILDVMAGSVVTNGSTISDAQLTSTGGVTPIQWEVARLPFSSPTMVLDNLRVSSDVRFFTTDFAELSLENGLVLEDGVVMQAEFQRVFWTSGDITSTGLATLQITGELEVANGFVIPQIGSGVTLEMIGTDGRTDGHFDNFGTIRTDGAGNIGLSELDNNFGTIEAVNGGAMRIAVSHNHGILHAGAGSTIEIENAVVRLQAGSQLTGDGDFVLRSGQLIMNGQTIDIDDVNLTWLAGRLEHGTITSATNTPFMVEFLQDSNDKSFVGMTLATDVHLSPGRFGVEDSLTLLNNAVIQPIAGHNAIRFEFNDAMTVSGNGRFQFGDGFNALETEQSSGVVIFDTGIFIDALAGGGIIGSNGDWISRGTIAVGTGQELTFQGNWSNEGTVILENDSDLVLRGEFSTDDFGTLINQGGTLVINGELDNTGDVLDLLFLPGVVTMGTNGVIRGGSIQSSGNSTLGLGTFATFDRVVLDLTPSSGENILVVESLTVNEELEIIGDGEMQVIDDDSDGVAHLLGTGTIAFRGLGFMELNGGSIEVGPDLTILQDQNAVKLSINNVTNYGTFDLRAGQTVIGGDWSNQGTMTVSGSSEVLFLGNYTTADLLSIDLQGGDIRLAGTLDNNGAVLLKDVNTAWLVVNQPTHSAHPGDGVKIIGGRIETADGQAFHNVASLDGVTLAGDVWLGDRNDGTIFNGLVFDGGTLHILDNSSSLYSGVFSGLGTIQFDTGRFQPPVLRFNNTSTPFDSEITVQIGNINGTVGESSYIWTNQATLRSFNPGLDLRVEGDVTHTGSAHAEDGGIVTFAALTNHGTLLAENGGIIRLESAWTNPTGQINLVNGGVLAVDAWSATPGSISLDQGVIRLELDTTLAGLAAFPQQAGSWIEITADLDLGGGTLDLDTFASTLRIDSGVVRNGTVIGSSPLQIPSTSGFSTLAALDVHTDLVIGDTGTTLLKNGTAFHGNVISGDGTLRINSAHSVAFDAVTLESTLFINAGATMLVTNGITLESVVASGSGSSSTIPTVNFSGTQSIGGAGSIQADTSLGLDLTFDGDLEIGADIQLQALQGTLSLNGAGNAIVLNGQLNVAVGRTANVTTGSFNNFGDVTINNSALVNLTAGTIINHGTVDLRGGIFRATDTDVMNTVDSVFMGSGIVALNGIGTFRHAGELSVAPTANTQILIQGHLASADTATTKITFRNNHSATLAFLQMNGDAIVDGELVLDAESLSNVELGDTQTLVLGATLSGEFDLITGLQIDPMHHWHLDYQSDRLIAEVRLAGDITGDGFVGGEDLDFILANWGTQTIAGNANAGDWSGDGYIGQSDLQVVLNHWGNAAPPESSVPEPSSLALLSLVAASLCNRRRRGASA